MKPVKLLGHFRDQRVVFFTGKGGVGKSALAWAAANALADQGRRIVLCTLSPFDATTTAELQQPAKFTHQPLTTLACFREYVLQIIKFERVYDTVFDNKVLRTFLLAAPGLSETVMAGKIWNLYQSLEFDTVLVDLPSTGHALQFFQSPFGVRRMFGAGFVHREASHICEMFAAPDCSLVVAALPEELSLVETEEFLSRLQHTVAIPNRRLVFNQCTPNWPLQPSELAQLPFHQMRIELEQQILKRAEASGMPFDLFPHFPEFSSQAVVDRLKGAMEGRW